MQIFGSLTVQDYILQLCAFWLDWTQWSECMVTCDSGVQTRMRSCENGNPGQAGCFGLREEQRTCANVVSS